MVTFEIEKNKRDQIAAFFAALGEVLSGQNSPPSGANLDASAIQQFFASAVEPLAQARSRGTFLNPWQMAQLDRQEVANSAVLAQLWDARRTGSRAIEFLDAFFRKVGSTQQHALPSIQDLQAGYRIQAEVNPLGELSDRIDILIESKAWVVGIEIKIDAAEGFEQLPRYRQALERLASSGTEDRRWTLVYLTPSGLSAEGSVAAKWQDVAMAAKSVIPKTARNREFSGWLLFAFAAHINKF